MRGYGFAPTKAGAPEAAGRDPMSTYYEDYWSKQGFQPTGRLSPVLHSLLREVATPTDACLDVGCGDGRTSGPWLTQHATSYLGLDVSETALAQARELGLHVQHIEDAGRLPVEDESFDVAVCLEVFEHLFEPEQAAREIHRALRPGGRLLVTVPNIAHWRPRLELAAFARWNPYGTPEAAHRPWADPHIRFFTPRTLGRMLSGVGFELRTVGGHGPAFLVDVPLLRSLLRTTEPGPVSRRLTELAPGLLARRVHAIAIKR